MSDYIKIGRTQKAHGLKGELKMFIEEQYLEDFMKNERIFLDVRGTKVPYFVEEVRGGQMIVRLEDVTDRDAATVLQARDIYLQEKDLIPEAEREFEMETLQYAHLKGYTIIDSTAGSVGTIQQVTEMPQQEMAVLRYQDREVMIPLNDQFIQRIDEEHKTVYMDLPEGILEL